MRLPRRLLPNQQPEGAVCRAFEQKRCNLLYAALELQISVHVCILALRNKFPGLVNIKRTIALLHPE